MKSPKVETGRKAQLHQGNTLLLKAVYVRSSGFLAINPKELIVPKAIRPSDGNPTFERKKTVISSDSEPQVIFGRCWSS
jgi:hypothetical protein